GGGRGIGAGIARELAAAGMSVAVAARSREQVEEVAREIDGLPVVADVSSPGDAEAMVAEVERVLGPIDLLVANAGISGPREATWEADPVRWGHTHEGNVPGVYLPSPPGPPGGERGAGRGEVGGRSGPVVAPPRGERPRRLPLEPRSHPGDDRARARPDRHHGERRPVPAG